MPEVEVQNLRKSYAGVAVIDDLSFAVDNNEVFALLGPNGAGKTTTVEILEGHRQADSGVVSVLGFDPKANAREFRERIGIVLQEAGFDEDFTVAELVRLHRGLYPRRLAVDELIDQVGLSEKRNARVKTLSGGQRRRLDLALGLVGDPECFSSTSRQPASTRLPAVRHGGSSKTYETSGRPFSSRRTTSTRQNTGRTAWLLRARATAGEV